MCHVSSPHEVSGSLHFKRRVRMEEKLIRKWCFFLNPSSAEAPFLLKKKICVSFTLPLQSLETPLQTMWQHQLNSQLSWGRDTPAWENIVTQHRLQACVCVSVNMCMLVFACVCVQERETERVLMKWRKLSQTIHSSECFVPFFGNSHEPEHLSRNKTTR